MTTGETERPRELPSPRDAMLAALEWLRDGEYEAAEAWICFARELREGTVSPWLPAGIWDGAITPRATGYAGETAASRVDRLFRETRDEPGSGKVSPDPQAPAPREPVPEGIDERLRVLQRPADLRFGGPPSAGPVAAQWQVGDRADCTHCHTPIMYVMNSGALTLWVHKYTDQRVCMTPDMGDTMVDLESTAVHTFAEPPTLG